MKCRFCGGEVAPDDLLHAAECDGRQGAVEHREPPVFDITAGRALRDDALARLSTAAPDFQASALHAIYRVACVHPEFITDQVWAIFDAVPEWADNRGMGAAMMAAKRNGWIEPTTKWQQSSMRQNHARPCRVWRSRLLRQAG